MKRLHHILKSAGEICAVISNGMFGVKRPSPTIQATAFSDSIVISDVWGEGIALWRVISEAALLSSLLLREGILCRGAIAKGKVIHDERVVFGSGFLAAYELERQVAIYPRLVIADNLVLEAEQLTFCRIKTDFDGFRFVDVFYQFSGAQQSVVDIMLGNCEGAVPSVDAFIGVRERVVRYLAEEKQPSILAKYRWLAKQFNEAVKDYAQDRIEPIIL